MIITDKHIQKWIHLPCIQRLKGVTQVECCPERHGVSSRFDHTMHVMDIAARIATTVGVDINLTRTIALFHDTGHLPFGHMGEIAINKVLFGKSGKYLYKHAKGSFDIVNKYLSHVVDKETLLAISNGVLTHNGESDTPVFTVCADIQKQRERGGQDYCLAHPKTVEGNIVKVSDSLAYVFDDLYDYMYLNNLEKIYSSKGECIYQRELESFRNILISSIGNRYKESGVLSLHPDEYSRFVRTLKRDINYTQIYELSAPNVYSSIINKVYAKVIFNWINKRISKIDITNKLLTMTDIELVEEYYMLGGF